jgi:hypothetical protein
VDAALKAKIALEALREQATAGDLGSLSGKQHKKAPPVEIAANDRDTERLRERWRGRRGSTQQTRRSGSLQPFPCRDRWTVLSPGRGSAASVTARSNAPVRGLRERDPLMVGKSPEVDRRGADLEKAHGRLLWLKQKLFHGFSKFAVMFVYLWVLFSTFTLYESVAMAERGVDYTAYGLAALNALVLGKVMLVVDELNVARGFEGKPLAYPILYRSVIFAVVFIAFRVVENSIRSILRGGTLLESLPHWGERPLLRAVSIGVLMTLTLIPYFAFKEIDRALGKGALRELVFAAKRKPGPFLPP